MEKVLGKISTIQFGIGGYQNCFLGLHICFDLNCGAGVCSPFHGTWCPGLVDPSNEHYKWSESDRDKILAKTMRFIGKLLLDAKKHDINELVGVPVEVTLDGTVFHDFRILKEVL